MSKPSFLSPNHQELAAITEYLLSGGTLGEISNMSVKAMENIYAMGYAQFQGGHYEEAARSFQYLCFYDHWNARNFISLGSCQKMLKLPGQAIKTYFYAARLAPQNPLPLVYIGDCYLELDNNSSATTAYQAALDSAEKHQFRHQELDRARKKLSKMKPKQP